MENPSYPMFSDELKLSFDPSLTYHYATLPSSDLLTPSLFNSSVLTPSKLFPVPDDHVVNAYDLSKQGNEDLNQYFAPSLFETNSPGISQLRSTSGAPNTDYTQSWSHAIASATPDWAQAPSSEATASLAVITKNIESVPFVVSGQDDHDTVVKNGQVTPADSPASPQSTKAMRKSSRKSKATSKTAVEESPEGTAAAPEQPKRKRRPRKARKPPTPEQEASRREMFLKRNREAAYKCRIKKKNQTEMIIERSKQLDADNARKGLEVQRLRAEVENLRALLLPHWRGCGVRDDRLSEYIEGLVGKGWGLGGGKFIWSGEHSGSVSSDFGGRRDAEGDLDSEGDGSANGSRASSPRSGAGEKRSADEYEAHQDATGGLGEPLHKRRRSGAVFEISLESFQESMAAAGVNHHGHDQQHRMSYDENIGFNAAISDGSS